MNATLSNLLDAMNAHDANRMAEWFAPDYHSQQPAHPNREYTGRDPEGHGWSFGTYRPSREA